VFDGFYGMPRIRNNSAGAQLSILEGQFNWSSYPTVLKGKNNHEIRMIKDRIEGGERPRMWR
jgi:hypothetical protein